MRPRRVSSAAAFAAARPRCPWRWRDELSGLFDFCRPNSKTRSRASASLSFQLAVGGQSSRLCPPHAGLPFVRHGYECVRDAYAALPHAHVVRGCKATRPVALTAAVVPMLHERVARAAVPRCTAESVAQLPSCSAAERVGVGYSAPSVVRVVHSDSVIFVQERCVAKIVAGAAVRAARLRA